MSALHYISCGLAIAHLCICSRIYPSQVFLWSSFYLTDNVLRLILTSDQWDEKQIKTVRVRIYCFNSYQGRWSPFYVDFLQLCYPLEIQVLQVEK